MPNKLKTISCDEIMSTPLAPIEFCIDTLLSQGLYLFAGAPKVGKSWLSLDICLSIANGEKVLGLNTSQGTALYLCLEDNINRLQSRLYDLTTESTDKLYFSLLADNIGDGLEQQIEMFKADHSDLKIVIIDTLQKIRNAEESAYGSDYKELSVLKNLADRLRITILLVHHLRKTKDTDPFNMISGSTGLRGCADGAMVLLMKDESTHIAKLFAEGRDIENRRMEIKLDSSTHRWVVLADDLTEPEKFDDEIVTALVTVMKTEKSFCGTPTELTARINRHTAKQYDARIVSKMMIQNAIRLEQLGILFESKRTNGKRRIVVEYIDSGGDDSAISDVEIRGASFSVNDPVESPTNS